MRYFFGILCCGIITVGFGGCASDKDQTRKYTEESYVEVVRDHKNIKLYDSSSDEVTQKRIAQNLTLGGNREDGLHRINYSNPNYMDIVIFTKRAKDYLKRNGTRRALDDFMSPDSQFVAGRMYIFAYATTGECLADWAEPSKVGTLGDDDFVRAARSAAELGGGWIEGVGLDPVARELRRKESYVVYAGDDSIVIGAGLYKN